MADHIEFKELIKSCSSPHESMTGPNDFKYSEERLNEMIKEYNRRSAIIPHPKADDIEDLGTLMKRVSENTTTPKPSNEEIALRLVEAWEGRPASFEIFVNNYLYALNTIGSKDA